MEPEGSVPCSQGSQEASTGPYPEPDQSDPHHPILSLYLFIYLFILYPLIIIHDTGQDPF
jgi:hypothetical protein